MDLITNQKYWAAASLWQASIFAPLMYLLRNIIN
jgi:hypothetical protein